jgi:hypothetical protein
LKAVSVFVVQANYLGLISSGISQFPQPSVSCSGLVVGQYLLANLTAASPLTGYPYFTGYSSSSVSVIEITDSLNLLVNPSKDLTGTSNPIPGFGSSTLHIFGLSNAVSSNVILAGVLVNLGNTNVFFLQASAPPPVIYSTNSYGLNLSSAHLLSSPTMERYILIGKESYTAYLTVWSDTS